MNVSAIYQWFNRRCLAAIILATISFWLGYWVGDCRLEARASESAQLQIHEFIEFADSLGCLDRDKLDEALIEAKAAMEGN
jgi:hypothetical protein